MPLGDPDDPFVRPTARAVLLDRQDRVLLILATISVGRDHGPESFWHMPGGLIEPGETAEQAARRECAEETGIRNISVGPCVWHRRHVAQWHGRWYDWRERYFLARTDHVHTTARHMEGHEREEFREHRWWSLDELRRSDEIFVPGRLAELLPPLVAGDLPSEPIDAGV
ncbi:MAG: NUDIX domain-containing protein [Chloroflexi bacterium]|nr:NUDIX domain-containing protein [Chloroflexota bacterium]